MQVQEKKERVELCPATSSTKGGLSNALMFGMAKKI